KQKPLPMHFSLLAGAIAGVSEIVTMYPLDVVKTRFQLQVGSGGKDAYTSIADCLQRIVKQEGFGALYRGIAAPIMVEAPKRAIKFSANEFFGGVFTRSGIVGKDSKMKGVLTGVAAGCTEAVVVVSFDLVKIRMQDKNAKSLYTNTADAFAKIYKNEGIMAFTKGFEATVWRHGSWNAAYFGLIGTIRALLPKSETKQGTMINNFIAGAIGGTAGTIINTPFDVVKTRIQSETKTVGAKYRWTLPAISTVAREEGFAALYKGFLPKVLRLGPGGGILLVVFDFTSEFIRKKFM
ncbi:hypothetical protein HK098_006418, partial [Nowakowskiella sp. JEL0407]